MGGTASAGGGGGGGGDKFLIFAYRGAVVVR